MSSALLLFFLIFTSNNLFYQNAGVMDVQYVTDQKGKTTAIQISLKQWKELQKGLKKLELFEELKQAFKEMDQQKKGYLKTPTTQQLLADL